jgi:hypothetical protein
MDVSRLNACSRSGRGSSDCVQALEASFDSASVNLGKDAFLSGFSRMVETEETIKTEEEVLYDITLTNLSQHFQFQFLHIAAESKQKQLALSVLNGSSTLKIRVAVFSFFLLQY